MERAGAGTYFSDNGELAGEGTHLLPDGAAPTTAPDGILSERIARMRRNATGGSTLSLEHYRDLFDAIPSPYMVLDTELRFVAVNDSYTETLGRSRDELVGRKLFDLFPNDGESGERLRDSLMRVIETGRSDTLSHIHYAIPNSDGDGFEDRYWTAIHFPLFNEDGYVECVVQNTVDVTELHALKRSAFLPFRSARLETALIRRAQEAEEAHRGLLEENNDFRRLFNQAPGMIAVLTGPDHVFSFANETYLRFIGNRHLIGISVRQVLPEIEGQGFIEKLDRVYATGEPVKAESARVVLHDQTSGRELESFVDFSFHPIFNNDSAVTGIFVQGLDRTENVRAERGKELLLRELNHRVKNLFTVAMSMVNMTARNAESPKAMADILTGRLGALSHAHGMVMNDEATGGAEGGRIAFEELLRKILAPHVDKDGGRLSLGGPEFILGSKAATSLALVTHELATNAAKYGALSTPQGCIAVHWTIEDDTVLLRWKESGGPKITGTPEPSGFGSRLSRISVEGQLDGQLSFGWPEEGIEVTITFPLENAAR